VVSPSVRLFLAFLAFTFFAAAAAAGPVTGRVIDPDGRPVPGAVVLLVSDAHPMRSAVTGANGEFTVEAPDSGAFDLRVSAPGFRGELRGQAPFGPGSAGGQRPVQVGEIRLTLSAVSESIVVSAAQVEIPLSQASSSVTVISGEELRAQQVRSLSDALRYVPGLTVAAAGGPGAVTGVFPRGGESNFTLVFVDDVPVTAFGGEYDFAHLTTENVERIEIVRGPQSALFGSNAIGAVVRVVTRRGGAPAASATLEAGGYGTNRIAGATSGGSGSFEWGASGERLVTDGYNGRRTASGLIVENDDYTRASGAVTAGWRGQRTALRAQVTHAVDERGTPGPFGTNPIGAYTGIDAISRGENVQTAASMTASFTPSPRVRSVVQAVYHRLDSDFLSPYGPSESHSRRVSVRAQVDFPLTRVLELSSGLEVQGEQAGSTFITDGTSPSAVPVRRTLAALFAEGRWSSASRLFVTAGARLDRISRDALGLLPQDDLVSLNPKGAIAWIARTTPAGDVTKLRASAATGIRPPGAFDIAFSDNPSLKPERSLSAEAAVEQAFAGGLAQVEAVAFFNRYDDLIVAVGSFSESSRYTTDNISNARARGLELSLTTATRLTGRTPVDLRARIAYTWLDSEVLAVDRDDEAPPPFAVGDPLLRRPRHQFSTQLTGSSGPLTVFLTGGARSRVLDVEPSFGTFGGLHYASGFKVWNLGAAWQVGHLGEVFGRVENVFGRQYEEALGFPALGRRGMVGLRVAAGR